MFINCMLWVRLPVNSRLSVKFGGGRPKVTCEFSTVRRVDTPNPDTVQVSTVLSEADEANILSIIQQIFTECLPCTYLVLVWAVRLCQLNETKIPFSWSLYTSGRRQAINKVSKIYSMENSKY